MSVTDSAYEGIASRLRNLSVAPASEGFFERAIANAETAHDSAHRPRTALSRLAGIAAALAVVAAALVVFDNETTAPARGIPEVAVTMHVETPVNVVFTSETALRDARLSLQLPAGIALIGHEGQSLSWTTDLAAGKNVLTLPIVAVADTPDSTLVARLEHATGTKTFRLKVTTI